MPAPTRVIAIGFFFQKRSPAWQLAGARRQVDDGKGGQSLSVAILGIDILLVNKLFAFRSNIKYRVDILGMKFFRI